MSQIEKRNLATTTLDIIAPVYNESDNIVPFIEAITQTLQLLPCKSRIIFVNDGSTDNSQNILLSLTKQYPHVTVIQFTRNFGKEIAITAGLEHATADICIPIDTDLQHPVATICDLVAQWEQGYDHVIAIRHMRNTDSFARKLSSKLFYQLFNACSDLKIPYNAGDFRLLARPVVNRLLQYKERNRFMKGLYAFAGGKTTVIYFDVQQRANQTSRFNFRKLLALALDAITAFSTIPLRIWSMIGVVICLFSGIYGGYLIIKKLFFDIVLPGYTSLMVTLLFFGGIQLISLGIIGEYLSRLFVETKQRPLYLVESIDNAEADNAS